MKASQFSGNVPDHTYVANDSHDWIKIVQFLAVPGKVRTQAVWDDCD
jgi:hypothetical protein